jgi:hypothetical protein
VQVETALRLYLALVRGLLLQPGEDVTAASKLSQTLTFRWSDSLLAGATVRRDAVFETGSMLMNVAFWQMRHAVLVAVRPTVSMDDAKEVHSSLRKAAGLIKFVQV